MSVNHDQPDAENPPISTSGPTGTQVEAVDSAVEAPARSEAFAVEDQPHAAVAAAPPVVSEPEKHQTPAEAPAPTVAASAPAAVADQHSDTKVKEQSHAAAPDSETSHGASVDSADSAQSEADRAAEEVTAEGMSQLLEQYPTPQAAAAEGEIFEGKVLSVTPAGVVVDVGGKFEGLVPASEFLESGGAIPFGAGQTIEVERTHEYKDGYVLLSHTKAQKRRVWEKIEKSGREHTSITAKVIDRIKGGVVVDIGLRAFLPASQIELRPVHDLDAWKDRELEVRVLKVNRKRGNIVVSRRVILEEEQKTHRDALMANLVEGAIVTGKVKNVTDYGVFVDLGGVDGLLHVSDLVWGRVQHPSALVKPGDDIQVQVLRFDKDKMRVSLGRKQLLPDPWATVPERFPAGSRTKGKVVGVTDYGAFVQMEPGVEGLIHVSEMSWSKRVKHPSKMVKEGDEVEVVVLEVKPEQHRISLGLKQTQADPWEAVAAKYSPGMLVSGRVRNLAEFGAFVELEEGVEGLIHVSDLTWTGRVKHPSEKLKKGEVVEAKILKVDSEHRRLSLGLKQVNDIWANWFGAHKVNDLIKGKVTRLAEFGAFVELAEGIEGLCHVSEIEERKSRADRGEREKLPRGQRTASVLTQGQEYEFKIIRIETDQHKISLSYRAAQKQVERQEMEVFRSAKSTSKATIGDAIMAKRQSP
jgi:small subunit ribosomal protein S1